MIPWYWLWFEPFECRAFLVFECRALVCPGLVVMIQRVDWVVVWHGERPGKSGAPHPTSTSSTSTSTLTATSVYFAYLIYMMHISTSHFSSSLKAPRAFTILYPWETPTPRTKRSIIPELKVGCECCRIALWASAGVEGRVSPRCYGFKRAVSPTKSPGSFYVGISVETCFA